jgi:hypothetical protein
MALNALVMGLTVFGIFKIFRKVKAARKFCSPEVAVTSDE